MKYEFCYSLEIEFCIDALFFWKESMKKNAFHNSSVSLYGKLFNTIVTIKD